MRANGRVEVVTPWTGTVLSVAEFADHVLPDQSAGDAAYQAALLNAVDSYAAEYLGRTLLPATLRVWFDNVDPCGFLIPRGPVTAVSSVTFYDRADTPTVVASSVYQLDTASEPARLVLRFGQIWPYDLRQVNAIAVQYTAGYASAAAVPAAIKHAMKIMLAEWYEERQPTTPGYVAPLPFGAEALMAPFRLTTGVA